MSGLKHTPIDDISKIHEQLYATFKSGKCRPLSYRRQQLSAVVKLCQENVDAIADALFKDIGKSRFEAIGFEIAGVVAQAKASAERLEEWTKPEPVKDVSDIHKPLNPTLHKTPKGPILVITPWNFPFSICFVSVIAAIASGNPGVFKPSEITPHLSQLLADIFPKYLDPEAYVIVNGAVAETTKLLELKWAHISYTGNGRIARIVAAAAAKHLTPLTLELGGKSPVYIDSDYDIELAAKRILFGKNTNAGQVCISPDFVLIHPSKQEALVSALKSHIASFHPSGALTDENYTKIVSPAHFSRLSSLLASTKGTVVIGGGKDEKTLKFETTVVTDVKEGDSLLSEEIFGPILPIVSISSAEEAIDFINSRDHPLVLYVFTENESFKTKFIEETISGALTFNDTLQAIPDLPFGGVGESGFGAQGLKYGFDDLSHLRATVDVPKEVEKFIGIRYPPYSSEALTLLTGGVFENIPA